MSADAGPSGPAFRLEEFPVHLGLGATVEQEPRFTGEMQWYEAYGARHAEDGVEARLVGLHTFTADWDTWEVHPLGAELVACVAGSIILHQEVGETTVTVTLGAGDAVINEPGVWHTADVADAATVLFVTAGTGTEVRPR